MGYTLDWDEAAGRLASAAVDDAEWYAAVAAGRLASAAVDDAEWYAAVAAELVRDTDRVAIDVGCGGAGMTVALARRMGPDATVVAADHNRAVLDAARAVTEAAGVRAEFAVVDLDGDLSALPEADLVWSSAAVHHAGDQQRTIERLVALLRPGGTLALAEGGFRPRHLPWDLGVGEPGLEIRLDAAQDRGRPADVGAVARPGRPGLAGAPWRPVLARSSQCATRQAEKEVPLTLISLPGCKFVCTP
ncbi:class I SAM-dependent methyltransferase [Dactylosporangium roseum]|uniref:class I SAM-dependent methyltransferase n=1 Tax=Dactylosporangium roseum TaxID=47989 RepID=UPI0021B43264|nr:class I SAM-dependent methyltransferase [Dactylosporangium roseum]